MLSTPRAVRCAPPRAAQVGDGTTSVVVLAGELLREAELLVNQKIHPMVIIAGRGLGCLVGAEMSRSCPVGAGMCLWTVACLACAARWGLGCVSGLLRARPQLLGGCWHVVGHRATKTRIRNPKSSSHHSAADASPARAAAYVCSRACRLQAAHGARHRPCLPCTDVCAPGAARRNAELRAPPPPPTPPPPFTP